MLGLPPLQTRAEPQEPRRMRVLQVKARLEAQERRETRSVRAAPAVPLGSPTLQPTQAKGGAARGAERQAGAPGDADKPLGGPRGKTRRLLRLQADQTA